MRIAKPLVMNGLGLLLLAFLFVELTVISATPAQRRRPTIRIRHDAQVADLFTTNCARCHGADGRGDTELGQKFNAQDFTDAGWWRRNSRFTSTARLMSIVERGKGDMPAFGKKLTRTQIRSLVVYVGKFKNKPSR